MRLLLLSVLLVRVALASSAAPEAECLASLLEPVAIVTDDSGDVVMYYGDDGGRLHRLEGTPGALRETKQVGVPSSVRAIGAADLDGRGAIEVVVVTDDGQLSIYDGLSLGAVWRSSDDRYSRPLAMAVANVDQDPPLEILLLADERLVIYDGSTHFKEWTSPEVITATDLLVADVDGDGEVEIVLSSGVVLSTVFFQTEWDAGEPFGRELFLLDMEGDSTPEIVARGETGTLRIFSVKDRREIW
ncbi:MAG: hypothetical protein MUE60_09240 [Candidatus Eisenbacteria bacterium]|jgi:hypothetical protein|nr:hypothetical protein [Candidatus Eisenbacteria bacterium]